MLKLISSVASTAPTDDKSREAVIWHPAAVAVNTQNLNDPLGYGKIDVVNLRLVSRVRFDDVVTLLPAATLRQQSYGTQLLWLLAQKPR